MINWFLKLAINRLDKDINNYRVDFDKERYLQNLYHGKGDFDTARDCYENSVMIYQNALWCIKWRNRMARRVGIQTIMAW